MKTSKHICRCILKSIRYASLFVVYLYAASFWSALASKFPWLERFNQSGSVEYAITITFKIWLYGFATFLLFYMNQHLFYMMRNTALFRFFDCGDGDEESPFPVLAFNLAIAEICLMHAIFIGF